MTEYIYGKYSAPIKIVLIYISVGALWIILSDRALELLVKDTALLTEMQTYKGWFYVASTSVMLYILINKHVSILRRSERSIKESESRLQMALNAGGMGTWDWDIVSRKLSWSVGHASLCGIALSKFGGTLEDFEKLVYKEDLNKIRDAIAKAIRGRTDYQCHYRVVWPDSSIHWVEARGRLVYNEVRDVIGMAGIVMDISERKRVEEEREALLAREMAARREAECANRAKDDFLATLSHELRTPMTSVLGWTRMLRSGLLTQNHIDLALETIERSAKTEIQLIEDLLDISRIISGNIDINFTVVNPTKVVEDAIAIVQLTAETKNINLELEMDADIRSIVGDPQRLQQVILNLLSNAIKFTPDGGHVKVALLNEEEYLVIKVIDSGKGISPIFLPHVFDRFSQADTGYTREHGGLGIGLAIVRHLVVMHGGEVHAESDGRNNGATFVVKLPYPTSDAELIDFERGELEKHSIEKLARDQVLKGLEVLLVDDDSDTLELLQIVLEGNGAKVNVSQSVNEALVNLQRSKPDIIVSDIGMPTENGLDLIHRIRSEEIKDRKSLPAIALTAYSTEEDRRDILEKGYNLHITKPVEPKVLVTAIAELVKGKSVNIGKAE
jgi:PAS domain S-box-containing protein